MPGCLHGGPGNGRLVIGGIELADRQPLFLAQQRFRFLLLVFCLVQFAAQCTPIPDRDIQRGRHEIAEVWHHADFREMTRAHNEAQSNSLRFRNRYLRSGWGETQSSRK